VFWGYNSSKFDSRFIMEKLLDSYDDINIIGKSGAPKSISFNNIIFKDLFLVLGGGSLNNNSKTFLGDD
jgi:hypothetical protein